MGKASRKKKASTKEDAADKGSCEKELTVSEHWLSKGSLHKTHPTITFVQILTLLLVCFVAYFTALFGDFVYDDTFQIVNNPWIKDVSNIMTILSKSVWSFDPEVIASNYYRPLMHLVFMLNYHLFGLKPWGFHLVNVLFHCGVTILVFLIMRMLLREQTASVFPAYLSTPLIPAMIFASHPIHTEAVTWIAGLPDVAFTFFYLLSLYFYIWFRDGAKRRYLLSILSFSIATLFKEPALTLPIILVAYDYLFKKGDKNIRAGIKVYIPYIAISGVYLLLRYYALRKSFAPLESYAGMSTYQYIINIFPLFAEYLTSLLWPFDLNLWHTFHPIRSLFEAKGMISILASVIFIIVTMIAYRKNKLFFFGLLLLLIPLLPVFYIKGITGKPFAERYLYLPSVGCVLLLAVLLSWAKEKLPSALAGIIMIVFMAIWGFYTVGTVNRNNVWRNNFNLWADTVKKSPDSEMAHYNLGNAYARRVQLDKAIIEYQTALLLKPDFEMAHNNLGLALMSQGQLDKAIAEYQAALRLKPTYATAHYNLGLAFEYQGLLDRATGEYQTALLLKPDLIKARQHLDDILSKRH